MGFFMVVVHVEVPAEAILAAAAILMGDMGTAATAASSAKREWRKLISLLSKLGMAGMAVEDAAVEVAKEALYRAAAAWLMRGGGTAMGLGSNLGPEETRGDGATA